MPLDGPGSACPSSDFRFERSDFTIPYLPVSSICTPWVAALSRNNARFPCVP